MALAADDQGRLLGVGRWIRNAGDPALAEVAVIIADDVQGQGLGTALGLALAGAARVRGVRAFSATIHAENQRAQRLFAQVNGERARGREQLAA